MFYDDEWFEKTVSVMVLAVILISVFITSTR